MNGRERGFLLLSSHLGDESRKVLSVPQLRKLAQRIRECKVVAEDRDMLPEDLLPLGYSRQEANRIWTLLSQQQQLDWYLQKGRRAGCTPVTRVSIGYPLVLRDRLGLDCPGCLWAKGDLSFLQTPMIALVGSRELRTQNQAFAYEAGKQAALQGFTLVSGNAKGADTVAQEACLEHGGRVISVVADRLDRHPEHERILYLSEDDFERDFSSQRALSRNLVIHSLPSAVLVAQCSFGKGGTWNGTLQNLHKNWTPVFCFDDGSNAVTELIQRGASPITTDRLTSLKDLKFDPNLFDQ